MRIGKKTSIGVAALAVAIGTASGQSFAGAAPAGTPTPTGVTKAKVITLTTGDRVHLTTTADGTRSTGIEPGPGRSDIGFFAASTFKGGQRETTVIPEDALASVSKGDFDARLFNVSLLDRLGVTDASKAKLADKKPSAPGPKAVKLTLKSIGRDGKAPAATLAFAVENKTGETHSFTFDEAGGMGMAEVPEGMYDVIVINRTALMKEKGANTAIAEIGTKVMGDTEVMADARKGRPVMTPVQRPDAKTVKSKLGLLSAAEAGGGVLNYFGGPDDMMYATPTKMVKDHRLEFGVGNILDSPMDAAKKYQYNLSFMEKGSIPHDLIFEAPDAKLAAVDTTYHREGDPVVASRGNYARIGSLGGGLFPILDLKVPVKRVEYYTPGVEWLRIFQIEGQKSEEKTDTFKAGMTTDEWNKNPTKP
ncbi:hypothetical protein [Streptomyces sp. KR80]|uniref:hypothetical protein n=1 Tax=Streptomyces sp. KR80 TaxID=3457426 RepID=UPI003FD595F6